MTRVVDSNHSFAAIRLDQAGKAGRAAHMDAHDLQKLGDVAKLIQSGVISDADHKQALALVVDVRAAAVEYFGSSFETTPAFLSLRDALGRDPTPEIEAVHASMAALEKSLRGAPDLKEATRQARRDAIDRHVVNLFPLVAAGCTVLLGLHVIGVM